ncbi:DUF3324 domain-containing protein [Enterococcus sp. 2201sp1_2201st1_B8_2201SCRN_220225]|uniref:WxL protein host-binding domain-containing protein n=1 Tax=unclassified Enterococcus TaxID=2608891 RepID=UPI0034A4CC1C
MTKLYKHGFVIVALLWSILVSPSVWATENKMGITLTPLQLDGLRVTTSEVTLPLDGKVHQLTLSVTNFSNQERLINYQGIQAVTNTQGQLTYEATKSFSGKVPLAFENLIPKASLDLAAGETKELTINLNFQQVDYGEVLGAIQMSSDETNYSLPVRLVGTKGMPNPQLAVSKIAGQLLKKLPALSITIENSAARLVEAEPMNLKVVHSQFFGLVKHTWQVNLAQVTWAPNGILNYPISMEGQALKSGSYRVYGTIGQGGNQVKVDKNFTLTKAEVTAINKQAPTVKDATLRWGIPVLAGLTVILILVITVALRQHKKSIRNKR